MSAVRPRKHNPTRQIELRQRHEDHVAKYTTVAVEHQKSRMRSQWEHSTDKKIGTTQLVRAMNTVQAQHDEVLMARRTRLAELLKTEREEHEHMLENLVVTDDQRRDRLMQQARDLRVEREQLRRAEAERRKDELFRDQSSQVREAQSRIKVLHVAAERRAQIEENERRKVANKAEADYWEELQQEEQRQQALRSQADYEKMHTRAKQIQRDLATQSQQNQNRKFDSKLQEKQEDDSYLADVRAGIAKDAETEANRRARQRQIAAETREMNETIDRQRAVVANAAREEEKKELDTLLQQIAEEEATEQRRKREAREGAVAQMQYVEAQMNAQAESETALDRRWEEENNRQWAKREANWQKEADKRNDTLRNVFDGRRQQVKDIRSKEETDLEQKRREHDELVANGQLMGDQDAEAYRKRRNAAIENRKFLERQIAEKQAIADSHKGDKKTELTAAQDEERRYADKIGRELRQLDDARPAEFQHVRLSSTKRAAM